MENAQKLLTLEIFMQQFQAVHDYLPIQVVRILNDGDFQTRINDEGEIQYLPVWSMNWQTIARRKFGVMGYEL